MARDILDAVIPHNRKELGEILQLVVVTTLWTGVAVQVVSLLS